MDFCRGRCLRGDSRGGLGGCCVDATGGTMDAGARALMDGTGCDCGCACGRKTGGCGLEIKGAWNGSGVAAGGKAGSAA